MCGASLVERIPGFSVKIKCPDKRQFRRRPKGSHLFWPKSQTRKERAAYLIIIIALLHINPVNFRHPKMRLFLTCTALLSITQSLCAQLVTRQVWQPVQEYFIHAQPGKEPVRVAGTKRLNSF